MKTQTHDPLLLNLAMIAVLCLHFSACSSEKALETIVQTPPEEASTTEQTTPVELEEPAVPIPGLPEDVVGYTQWLKLNAEPIPPVPGGDPHNGDKNVYVNKTRETIAPNGEQQFPYPDGSIVVKEAYRPGKDYVGLIAIMRKKVGVDPDHNDWEFIEYTRNAPDADFAVIAKDGVCWGCHVQVQDIDYIFTALQ